MVPVRNGPHAEKPNSTKVRQRVSERLRLQNKIREVRKKLKPPPRPSSPCNADDHPDVLDLARRSIEHGNPAHKLLFMTCLGLIPKSDAKLPPYLQLERLPAALVASKTTVTNSSITLSSSSSNDEDALCSDSDIEDLDLEIVFCPLDIPEIYQEITKKPCPVSPFPVDCGDVISSSNSDSNNGSCESGYESCSTNSTKSMSPPQLCFVSSSSSSNRSHCVYKSTGGVRQPKKRLCKGLVMHHQQPQSPSVMSSSRRIPLITLSTDKCLPKPPITTCKIPIENRRSVRVSVKMNPTGISNCVNHQVKVPATNQKNLMNHHWTTTNGIFSSQNVIKGAVPHPPPFRKILGSSQRNPIYQVSNSINDIKRRLLALNTHLDFVND